MAFYRTTISEELPKLRLHLMTGFGPDCVKKGQGCPLKEKCTRSAQRRLTRWEHQDVLDEMQVRLAQNPDAMRIRRSAVEHPYGTIKAWMGATHFLTKGLERVKTEMSLHVLAYNLKRLIALLGIAGMMDAISSKVP